MVLYLTYFLKISRSFPSSPPFPHNFCHSFYFQISAVTFNLENVSRQLRDAGDSLSDSVLLNNSINSSSWMDRTQDQSGYGLDRHRNGNGNGNGGRSNSDEAFHENAAKSGYPNRLTGSPSPVKSTGQRVEQTPSSSLYGAKKSPVSAPTEPRSRLNDSDSVLLRESEDFDEELQKNLSSISDFLSSHPEIGNHREEMPDRKGNGNVNVNGNGNGGGSNSGGGSSDADSSRFIQSRDSALEGSEDLIRSIDIDIDGPGEKELRYSKPAASPSRYRNSAHSPPPANTTTTSSPVSSPSLLLSRLDSPLVSTSSSSSSSSSSPPRPNENTNSSQDISSRPKIVSPTVASSNGDNLSSMLPRLNGGGTDAVSVSTSSTTLFPAVSASAAAAANSGGDGVKSQNTDDNYSTVGVDFNVEDLIVTELRSKLRSQIMSRLEDRFIK